MTETLDRQQVLQALELIDRGLGDLQHRRLVTTDEMADLLLDVRSILAAPQVELGGDAPVAVTN
ncbi:MAG: hypothetical protein OES57_02785 [Acidimicrobiia bacterium]|nr:hypothetical protein [Acidimicrobiia bacterium]